MAFPLVIAALGALIAVDVALSTALAVLAIRRQRRMHPRPLARYPSVTVIRPVRGCDPGARENFAAALDTGYPGPVQTIFVFDDESDPGLPVARAVVEAHRRAGAPGLAEILIVGSRPPPGRTGKLHAMIVASARARGELVAFGDSDTRPDRDVLRVLVEKLLGTPHAGAAFAPILVEDPRSPADVAYALLVNALYGPAVARSAGRDGELPFIMGELMVFTRTCLAAIGGVGCAQGHLVDDMWIGRCVAELGLRNVQVAHRLPLYTDHMKLADFARIFRRWLLFSRNGLPTTFTAPLWRFGIEFWIALVAVVVGLAFGAGVAALAPAFALVVHGTSLVALHREFGGRALPPRTLWVPWGLFLAAPVFYAATRFRRAVSWRGNVYEIDLRTARLA